MEEIYTQLRKKFDEIEQSYEKEKNRLESAITIFQDKKNGLMKDVINLKKEVDEQKKILNDLTKKVEIEKKKLEIFEGQSHKKSKKDYNKANSNVTNNDVVNSNVIPDFQNTGKRYDRWEVGVAVNDKEVACRCTKCGEVTTVQKKYLSSIFMKNVKCKCTEKKAGSMVV